MAFFLFLLAYLLIVVLASAMAWFAIRADESRISLLSDRISRLRSQRPIYLLALIAPWLFLVGVFDLAQGYAVGRSAIFQASTVGLVIVLNLVVLLEGKSSAKARETAFGMMMVAVGITLALGTIEYALRRFPQLIPDAARSHLPGNGFYLRRDLVFEKPIDVGYRFLPLQDRHVEFWASDGDLFEVESGNRPRLDSTDDHLLARIHFVTDEIGYPNKPSNEKKRDIVVAGDSFTAPGAVAKPWPQVLAELQTESVLNLSVPGYSTQAESKALQLYGLDKAPDWVILAYFEGNDLIIDAPAYEARRRSGLSWTEYDLAQAGPLNSLVSLQSLRYGVPALIYESIRPLLAEAGSSEARKTQVQYPITTQIADREIKLAFLDTYLSALTARQSDIEDSRNFDLVEEALLTLKRASEDAGAEFLILYIPSKEHIYFPLITDKDIQDHVLHAVTEVQIWPDGYLSAEGATSATSELILDHLDDQRNVLSEFARSNSIHFLDLSPTLATRAAAGEELYYLTDTHWNQQGHQLAGRLVAEYLDAH